MNALAKLKKARTALVLERPFFGSLALRLKMQQVDWHQTCATDGTHLYFNAEFIESNSFDEVKAILAHEVMHCALGHPWRRGYRDADQWNRAADYVINDQLKKAGFTLPAEALLDSQYDGMSTERVYDALNKPSSDDTSDDDDNEQSNDNAQDDNATQDAAGDSEQNDTNSDENDTQAQSPDGRAAPADPTGMGSVMDAPPGEGHEQPTEADYREQQQEWKQAMTQAAQAERASGAMTGNMESLIGKELAPKADWRALLREFITQHARDDYAWNPPNRRYVHQGIYLPSVRSERCPPIVVAVDTSGSISDAELSQFQGEINTILEDVAPELVHVVYCDSRVNAVDEFEPQDLPIELRAVGRGGTAFQPVFNYVETLDDEPAALIYLTDMFNADTITDPGYPVLWADYCGRKSYDLPDFGQHIIIE